ncbi:MAG: hypothetical protein R3B99_18785 [Polyangiales bacterium]
MKPLSLVLFLALAGLGCTTAHERPADPPPAEEPVGLRPSELSSRTDTPLLFLPARYMGQAVLTAERPWYAASYRDEQMTLFLSGTIAFVDPPDDLADMTDEERTPNAIARGFGAWDTVNEGIRSLAWEENGAAYTLEVECASPIDRRCTDEAFLRELADQLEVQP